MNLCRFVLLLVASLMMMAFQPPQGHEFKNRTGAPYAVQFVFPGDPGIPSLRDQAARFPVAKSGGFLKPSQAEAVARWRDDPQGYICFHSGDVRCMKHIALQQLENECPPTSLGRLDMHFIMDADGIAVVCAPPKGRETEEVLVRAPTVPIPG